MASSHVSHFMYGRLTVKSQTETKVFLSQMLCELVSK
jgi:hypothetical protein